MTGDHELLQEFTRTQSEDAFAVLVNRHLGLVYTAALRHVRSPQLAEEVAQSAFSDLARQARQLAPETILTAWLYQVTRRTAIDVVRRETRRQVREQIAAEMNAMNATAADWTHIEPLLDDAMEALDETDRAAVLLRYFENKSLREVGAALGSSEDAAQKRVSRALERLREFFSTRGTGVAAGGLAAALSAHAVQAAPVGMAAAISHAVAGTALTVLAATTTAVKTIAMTTLQKSLAALAVGAAVVTGAYEAAQSSRLSARLENLEQRQAPLDEQIRKLQHERDEAARQIEALRSENVRLVRNSADLLKLRGENTRLRNESLELARFKAQTVGQDTNGTTAETQVWQAKVNRLKQRLQQSPGLKIPEFDRLSEQDWLAMVKELKMENEADFPEALGRARKFAKASFAPEIANALRAYALANDNQVPTDLSQLESYFHAPVDPAILARYQPLQTGALTWDKAAIAERAPVDPNNDSQFQIGAGGFWYQYPAIGEGAGTVWDTNTPASISRPTVQNNPTPPDPEADLINSPEALALAPVMDAYKAERGGKEPEDPAGLAPYLRTAADRANFWSLLEKAQSDFTPDQLAALEKLVPRAPK